jgi:hypothetical protein
LEAQANAISARGLCMFMLHGLYVGKLCEVYLAPSSAHHHVDGSVALT